MALSSYGVIVLDYVMATADFNVLGKRNQSDLQNFKAVKSKVCNVNPFSALNIKLQKNRPVLTQNCLMTINDHDLLELAR